MVPQARWVFVPQFEKHFEEPAIDLTILKSVLEARVWLPNSRSSTNCQKFQVGKQYCVPAGSSKFLFSALHLWQFYGYLLDHLGVLPRFSATVPSRWGFIPWMMLTTNSLTALCYCLHHLHQFHNFQLGSIKMHWSSMCGSWLVQALQNIGSLHIE